MTGQVFSPVTKQNKHTDERDRQVHKHEVVLSDVSVKVPNSQCPIENIEFGQEVEIHFLPKGNNNNHTKLGPKKDKSTKDQENIEPSGPVRALNFTDCDDKNSCNSLIHRPKPVLPSNAYNRSRDSAVSGSSKESTTDTKQHSQTQSAFSRISKEKKTPKCEKDLPGEKELGKKSSLKKVFFFSKNLVYSDYFIQGKI